jgi:predicted RNase H-like HicB family nuclease
MIPRTVHHPTATKGARAMKRTFTASIMQEGDWYVAQCLEVDVASQGETEEEALVNLREALALHFTPPVATELPDLRPVDVEIGAG